LLPAWQFSRVPVRRLAAGNPWGKAQKVPGTAALNIGHEAEITSVSCASAGKPDGQAPQHARVADLGIEVRQPAQRPGSLSQPIKIIIQKGERYRRGSHMCSVPGGLTGTPVQPG
jgi:hypothetical protein